MTSNDNLKKENTNLIKSEKVLINLIAFAVMIIMAVAITRFYPQLKRISKMQYESVYDDVNLMESIANCNMFLYKEVLDNNSNENLSLTDAFIKSYDEKSLPKGSESDSGSIESTNISNILYNRYSEGKDNLNSNFKNLDYVVLDKDHNVLLSNNKSELKDVVLNSEDKIQQLKDVYGFFVAVNYNESGKVQIINCTGIEEFSARETFGNNIDTIIGNNLTRRYNLKFNNIKDTTIIYGIPKELKYKDSIADIVNRRINGGINQDRIVVYGFIVGCIILMAALVVPYKKSKQIAGNSKFFNVPFEINCILYGLATIIFVSMGFTLVMGTLTGEAETVIVNVLNISSNVSYIVYAINVALWTMIIYFILNGVTLLKHIFKYGFRSYMKENLLILRIWKFVVRKSDKLYYYIIHIDLSDKTNKDLIKIIAINFVILSLISIIWVFGIIAAFVYSVILFVIAKKYYDDIKDKFRKLLAETNKIANGNLEGEITEDLGIFNPFKDELKEIQSGFKKAVDEEIKSQKMKTELISNVSHDLKTPLTSIITYVDLLKKDDITEEERKLYIDTLDKKSQRLKFLIEDLFEVSKANSGNVKVNLVKVDIVELIKQSEFELEDKFNKSKLTVKNNFPEDKIVLSLDSQKTFRIFENLFNNVSKYAMENSRVYVDVIEDENEVTILIKNISADEMNFNSNEIIERFTRGDKSRNTEGSGLGLAIVKSFVELQNGRFNIDIDGDLFKAVIKFNK
ncbi:HAMP domain-containing sensor histidine kinase [Clostridium sp. SM-530-WT-3G]|uniref:sensor histidine kinase n=1 Tax=Clostridium sp. SM-530-WT-3G TaxID=2725303 RepID=UPI001FAD55B3|nr:HAMP domain-containing sensor histidine kinase [Clostridium sp. SM-530-WT-3G]